MSTDASLLLTGISEIATPRGTLPVRGNRMSQLDIIPDAAIAIRDGIITWVGPRTAWNGSADEELDLGGRAVIPALVDPHTHAIWAGDRLADFEDRCNGVGYETILARGGGIRSTVRQTAAASMADLVALAGPRIDALVACGAASIEVKSGYGFDPEAELRSLHAIARLSAATDARIVPTLLIHIPPTDPGERKDYLDSVCRDLIPAVAREELAIAVDIFIERESFSVAEAEQVFRAAGAAKLAVKAHADQFHAIGGVELAVRHGALSADHLEASGDAQIAALASGSTVATILPGVSLHLGLPAAPGRKLIDAGAMVAVGTDLNPGSSPLFSTQQAMALAVRLNGLRPAEALTAATVNAAAALGLDDTGAVAVGARADLLVLDDSDWRAAPYTLGGSPVMTIFAAGQELDP